MLVLTRKQEEEILIGKTIIIKILSVRGRTVRIGITAPQEITISRPDSQHSKGAKP